MQGNKQKHAICSCLIYISTDNKTLWMHSFITDSKSSAILKKHQDDVVQVLPVQSTELLETLHAEDIITSETRNEVKDKGSEALVQAIVKTLDEHPDKLHSVVKILLRDETVSIGEKMRKDLGDEYFNYYDRYSTNCLQYVLVNLFRYF